MKKILSLIAAFCLIPVLPVEAENSRAACVLEAATGAVVYENNSVARLPMASTTKIMTCITALESGDLEREVTVSKNAALTEGSSAYLGEGDCLSMRDLLYGLMLNSGNDAAVAAAENISGSVEKFVKLMNDKALEIGVKNTHFTNPNGLPDEEHYTTAYDLAEITRYAMKNDEFRKIVSTESYTAKITNTGGVREFTNHNRLLREYEGCTGVKTGYTEAAGRCLVTSAERGGMTFIAVTLNDPDDWKDHKELLDNAFSRYTLKQIAAKGDKADVSDYDLIYGEDLYIPVKKDGKLTVKARINVPSKLKPPVAAGEKVGYAEFMQGKEVLGTVDLCSAKDLYEEPSFKDRFITRIKRICNRILF